MTRNPSPVAVMGWGQWPTKVCEPLSYLEGMNQTVVGGIDYMADGTVRDWKMNFYYLSFCDVTKPAGTQFLGATVVLADSPEAAIKRATLLGINPGGEVAMKVLSVNSIDDLPPEARKFVDAFVASETVIGEGARTLGESGVPADASVCQLHNPVKS